jgi:hypothetical protein
MRYVKEDCFAKSGWVDHMEALFTLLASSSLAACKLALSGYNGM